MMCTTRRQRAPRRAAIAALVVVAAVLGGSIGSGAPPVAAAEVGSTTTSSTSPASTTSSTSPTSTSTSTTTVPSSPSTTAPTGTASVPTTTPSTTAPAPPAPEQESAPAPNTSDRLSPLYVGAPWFQPGRTYNSNFPDPTVIWDGSRYWAYATSTGGPKLPVMWSTDLVTWTARDAYSPNPFNGDQFFNDAFPTPPSWSIGGSSNLAQAQWAPGIARIRGRYVLYSSWEVSPGRRCLSSAGSYSPAGPFVDSASQPLWCDGDPGGSIDAEPFVDADGTPYLLWKSEGVPGSTPTRIWARQLSPDGGTLLPGAPSQVLLSTAGGWEGSVIENPSMVASGGSYWLLYSGNDWSSGEYRMGAARCASPLGPCTRTSDQPLVDNTDQELGPGGGSLFKDATGRLRLAYHTWNAPYTSYPANPNCDGGGHCASQGQRRLQIDAVAAPPTGLTASPIGFFDQVTPGLRQVQLSGWALDPSGSDSIEVHVYVDGVGAGVTVASIGRPDLAAVFPGIGTAHGFSIAVPASGGSHQVCAYGINVGAGGNSLLGCRTVTVPTGSPVGSLDGVSAGPGNVTVAGWALDPDVSASLDVHVYVDGVGTAISAKESRTDVGGAFPGYGANHGFWATVPASGGPHQVCVWAINQGAGGNSLLGCRSVTVPTGPPVGSLDAVASGVGSVSVWGWAIDPDVAAPLDVHVYVDGAGTAVPAKGSRVDVGGAFPGYGANHGFSATVPATPGAHEVCVWAINQGAGGNSLLGCRTATVPSGPPFGSLDAVTASVGQVSVQGWAIDPDVTSSIGVHVYVDGVGVATVASGGRPDVGGAFPSYGSAHGFTLARPVAAGSHQVCAWAINVGLGGNTLLGCRTVTVPG